MCAVGGGEYKNAPQMKSLFEKGLKRGFTAERGIFNCFVLKWITIPRDK